MPLEIFHMQIQPDQVARRACDPVDRTDERLKLPLVDAERMRQQLPLSLLQNQQGDLVRLDFAIRDPVGLLRGIGFPGLPYGSRTG